ncbi:VENN motif pre-toxin domain-containing protein [Cronobacter muytjensii]|nr:VENN motif pre-toxin domain-containing protein [Cronobacter muytjensii]
MSHTGGGFSSSGSFGAQGALNAASTLMSAVGSSGHAHGTTQAAVSEGTIVIRDKTGQQQDMASLSRDVANANDAISPIFNKEKEQKRLQIAQMTGDIAGQMSSMVMTEGDINALKAARAVPGNAHLSAEELKQTQAYRDAFSEYGTGGKYQQIAQSASAAIAGLVNGDFSGAVAGAAAPFIATFVKKHTDEDSAQRILAHALAGAVIAKAQGKDALAGAAGASAGEMTAKLALDLYGKKPEQLGEDERQLVSALSSVAAGLAGAAVSDNTAGVQTAAQAGKNAVENNFLGPESQDKLDKAVQNQQSGKDLLAASREIVRQNNVDRQSDELVAKYLTEPQSMTQSERQQLAAYLNVYGYELQTKLGFTPEEALQSVNSILSREPALKPSPGYPGGGGDTSSYYEALGYLKMYSAQSGQAAMGTDALLTLPGGLGTAARATLAAGGAWKAGTGIGQIIDGQYHDGALNVSLGSIAIFGGVAGQNIIKKTDTGIFTPESTISWQESSGSTGKNIFPVDMLKISPENLKYVDILSPEARQHILYGESLTTGGHMYPGNPGKTIFPSTWPANKIVNAVGDIATSPDTTWYAQTGTGGLYTKAGRPSRWVAWETRDNVRVRVVYEPANGKVITAFPDAGLVPPTLKPVK